MNYIKNLFLFSWLTIILALHSLNRLGSMVFDYPLRNLFEHFLSGFYLPLFGLFVFYTSWFITKRSPLNWKIEYFIILFTGLGIAIWELYYQMSYYNSESLIQLLFSFIGISACWIYFYFQK